MACEFTCEIFQHDKVGTESSFEFQKKLHTHVQVFTGLVGFGAEYSKPVKPDAAQQELRQPVSSVRELPPATVKWPALPEDYALLNSAHASCRNS